MNWSEISKKLRYASSDDFICGMNYKDAAQKLLQEGERTNNPKYLSIAWYSLGVCQSEDAHSADKGTEYLTRALEQAKICEDYELINGSYILMGQLLRSQRIYSQAMEYFLQAARAGRKCPDPVWCVGRANAEIAILYHQIGEYQLALTSMQKALQNMKTEKNQIQYERHIMSVHILLGHWYLDADQDTVSSAHEVQILKEHFRGSRIWKKEHYDVRLLCLEIHLAEYVGAESAVQQMTEQVLPRILDAIDDTRIVDDLCGLLRLMIQKKQFDTCEVLSGMAKRISRDCLPGIRSQILELLIQYYEASGNMQECYHACYEYYQSMQERHRDEQHIVVITMHRQQVRELAEDENKRLTQEAQTDELTGLPNRYGMNANASVFYEDCYQKKIFFGFEVMDLDYFKQYNDTYGHQAGDMVLQKVAGVLLALHESDPDIYAARYGGDEIVVLYRGKSNEEIEAITKKIDGQIRALAIPHRNSRCADIVTVSQGVVNTIPVNAVRLWDYMSSADYALYDVKNSGKGTYRIVNEINTADGGTLYRNDPPYPEQNKMDASC